jgi:hypothetical protein
VKGEQKDEQRRFSDEFCQRGQFSWFNLVVANRDKE